MCSDTFRDNEASVLAAQVWFVSSALFEGRKHLVAHKHILEICRLTDNFRDGEDNRCGPSNLRLNVQNKTYNKVLQNAIASLNDSRFVMSACTLFAESDIAATQHVLCAAKDETSVEFMGRMFCCNFLRKS
jgi:hypothetical protein